MFNKKITVGIFAIFLFLSTYTSYSFFVNGGENRIVSPLSDYKAPKSNGNGVSGETNEPKTEECPLNGELLTKTQKQRWEARRPLGVMIENHKEARPQSGLSSADIVYEAVAEGGITRFLAIFYCKDASYIGPIRSARIYFVKLLQEYGQYPLYAHVGGANTPGKADALGEIKDLGWGLYNDLNQFAVPFPYYWRDYERLPGRATEHTVYSSTSKLWKYAKEKRGLTNADEKEKVWDSTFKKWKFTEDASLENRGDVNKASFGFWNLFASDYGVIWTYDKNTNAYVRENGGEPHQDKNNNKQISSKNVVVVFAQESPANDGYEGGHLLYKIVGKGDGLIFQNGKAREITWEKKDEKSRMTIYEKNGGELSFVRGQIFIEILPVGNKVSF